MAYGSVHAKLYIPFYDEKKKESSFILGEVQFHLREICDGTLTSCKERQHILYEKFRNLINKKPPYIELASDLIYASSIWNIAKSVDIRVKLSNKEKDIIATCSKEVCKNDFLHLALSG
jgi:hypothetical protein